MLSIRTHVLGAAAVAALALGATPAIAQPAPAANPFAAPSPLPFHAPQFDKIKDSDFQPAFEEGMARQLAEIDKIANSAAPATFENTIVAMEKSGQMLDRVSEVFFALTSANTNDALQKVQAIEAPKLAAHHDAIYLNAKLFARVKTIYERRDKLTGPEQKQLIKVYYDEFVRSGANLSNADKAKLRELNKTLSSLETTFEKKLLAGTKAGALVVSDKAALAGLGADAIAAAADAAKARGLKGKWVLPLQNTTQQPALTNLTDRATRKELFEHSWTRTEKGDANDTRQTIATIAKLRAEKATLLGYPELRRLCAREPDGQDAEDGARASWTSWCRPRARRRPVRPGTLQAADRQGRQALQAPALGLGVLCREAAQGEIRSRREPDQALFRARQCAEERRLLCRHTSSTA